MARHGGHSRRPARPKRRNPLAGVLAGAGAGIVAHPWIAGGLTAFAVTFAFVAANAVWNQPRAHPSPLFVTRVQTFEPVVPETPQPLVREVTRIRIERPDEDLKRLQAALKEQGFYRGTVDGLDGPQTARAIRDYGQARDIPTDQMSTAEIADVVASDEITTAAVPAPRPKKGPRLPEPQQISAETIMRIQAGLRAAGDQTVDADGIFGIRTEAAIRAYQARKGLRQTGRIDVVLIASMEAEGLIGRN